MGIIFGFMRPRCREWWRKGIKLPTIPTTTPDLVQSSDALVRQEVDSLAQALTQITGLKGDGGIRAFYLRPALWQPEPTGAVPGGDPGGLLVGGLQRLEVLDANHLVTSPPQTRDGDIILVHETGVPSTAQGLDRLLTQLQSQGFEAGQWRNCSGGGGITPQAGKLYFSAQNTGVNRCAKALYFDESKLDTHWAYPAISFALEQGFMSKNQYGEFTPNFPLTRGMFCHRPGAVWRGNGGRGGALGLYGHSHRPLCCALRHLGQRKPAS